MTRISVDNRSLLQLKKNEYAMSLTLEGRFLGQEDLVLSLITYYPLSSSICLIISTIKIDCMIFHLNLSL